MWIVHTPENEHSPESAVAGCKTRSTTVPLNHGQRRCGISHTAVIVLSMFVAVSRKHMARQLFISNINLTSV